MSRPGPVHGGRAGASALLLSFLLGSLAGVLVGCSAGPPLRSVIWARPDTALPPMEAPLRERAALLLSRAVRFDTTNPPGNEGPLARYLAGFLTREGIEAQVIETPGDDRAALWAIVPGRSAAPPLVLLSHLDTVPAEASPDGSSWSFDPMSGSVGAGYVVGRGTLDAKGITVVHALTLVVLARRGVPPPRTVILLATPDEETGGRLGAGWLVRERPELLRGASHVLTEGSSILPGEREKGVSGSALHPEIWGVAFTEKTPCWLEMRAAGVPGHGAAPVDSAVARLLDALGAVDRIPTPVRVVPEVATMFQAIAAVAPPSERGAYQALGRALESDAAFRERFLSDPGRRALVQDTLTVTVLQGSERVNVLPARASARIDARLLPDRSCADLAQELRRAVDDPGVTIDVTMTFAPTRSPVDDPLLDAIRRVAAARGPDIRVVPRVIAGFTDAHWMRERGLRAYGFVPRRLRPAESRGIHGPNERISVENLELGVEVLVAVIEEFVEGGTSAP